jgi:hypothetical protein
VVRGWEGLVDGKEGRAPFTVRDGGAVDVVRDVGAGSRNEERRARPLFDLLRVGVGIVRPGSSSTERRGIACCPWPRDCVRGYMARGENAWEALLPGLPSGSGGVILRSEATALMMFPYQEAGHVRGQVKLQT